MVYQFFRDFAGPVATVIAASVAAYFVRQQVKVAEAQAEIAQTQSEIERT